MAKFVFALIALGFALASAQDYTATNYNAGDSGRSETVAPDGSVRGQYSYTDPNGKLITVKYRAGKDGYHVEGDHLPKAPSAQPQQPSSPQQGQLPAVPQHTDPAVLNYNPFVNPNVPNSVAAPVPQAHHNTGAYNPFHNPHVHNNPAPAPVPPPAPQSHNSGYNPFHNPHVPAHLYQQAPTHAPVAPTHPPVPQHHNPHHAPLPAPQLPQVPQHTDPAVTNYNPFYNPHTAGFNPFHNPNVPAEAYRNAPKGGQNNHYQQPAPQHHQQPSQSYPGAFGPAGSFPGFSHPNSIHGNQYNKY